MRVDGYAMSIGSVIPLAASKVISPPTSIWMVHCASFYTQGNAKQLRKDAEMLEQHDSVMLAAYVKKTGKKEAEMREAMEEETYYTGIEAIALGLADEEGGEADTDPEAIGMGTVTAAVKDTMKLAGIIAEQKRISAAVAAAKANTAMSGNNERQTMTKSQIVAWLKARGIEASETETEEQLLAKMNKIPTAAAPPALTVVPPPAPTADNALALVQAERKARISDKLTTAAAGKIPNAALAGWLALALQDEAGTLAIIAAMPTVPVAADPAGGHVEFGAEPVLAGWEGRPSEKIVNLFKEHGTVEARYEALKRDYHVLSADECRREAQRKGVRAENTFSATITTNFLIMGCTTKLGPKIASLKAFSKDNAQDPYKPLATGVMKFNSTVQDGSTTVKNATVFNTVGDSTVDAVSITVDQYTEKLHLTNAQLNSGFRMDDLITAKLGSFGSKIMQVATAPITAANFATLTALVRAPGAFGFGDLAVLWGQLKKANTRNIILDGEYLARLLNNPSFLKDAGGRDGSQLSNFGWDYCGLNTEWAGADANVRGFACDPQAIGVISGLPLNPPGGIPGNIVQTGVAQIAGAGIGVATYLWYSPDTRTLFATYDIMLGSSLVDASAGVLVKSQ